MTQRDVAVALGVGGTGTNAPSSTPAATSSTSNGVPPVAGGGLAQAGPVLLGPLRHTLDLRRTFHGAALLALDLIGAS
jgi:hypothetical protein